MLVSSTVISFLLLFLNISYKRKNPTSQTSPLGVFPFFMVFFMIFIGLFINTSGKQGGETLRL